MQPSLSASDLTNLTQMGLFPPNLSTTDTPTTDTPTTDTEGSIVRYRVGLNPVQQTIRDHVAVMPSHEVCAFTDAFCAEVTNGLLVPVFPSPDSVAAIVTPQSRALFTPNDLVEYAGLHADTVDKYLHNYIGVLREIPGYKQDRMTYAHYDAPWGKDYAPYLNEPLPLRLVSARALVFVVMAPASIYRPTTGDEELVARWKRLVAFRNTAFSRFGVPKGAPKRIDGTVQTITSVRRTPHAHSNKPPSEDTAMPIPALFALPVLPVGNAEVNEAVCAAVAEVEAEGTEDMNLDGFKSVVDGAALDLYFDAIADLRARAEKLRGLLDLLPPQEVDKRVTEFFRVGLDALDRGRK